MRRELLVGERQSYSVSELVLEWQDGTDNVILLYLDGLPPLSGMRCFKHAVELDLILFQINKSGTAKVTGLTSLF